MSDPSAAAHRSDSWAAIWDALPNGFAAARGERDRVDAIAGKKASAYGEVLPESAERLFAWLRLQPSDVFYDLGSGVGRLIAQAVETTAVGRAVGVELCRSRHEVAVTARGHWLDGRASHEASRMRFVHADFRTVDVADATVAWAGSTCYPDALLGELAENLASARGLRCLVSTKPLPAPWDERFVSIGKWALAATWAPQIRVFLYRAPR